MKRLAPLLALFLCFQLIAQDREAAIWHFGQFAGLDFNSLTPQNLNRGIMFTYEGCSTMSDENGNLLFYSDGVEVYSGDHQLVGGADNLLGSFFSTQSALIVPNPRSNNSYYVFTASDLRVANQVLFEGDGINYYTVNLSNGRPSFIPTVNHLVTYDENDRVRALLKSCEKLTAVKHPEEDMYWVMAHFEDTFYAFKVDNKGVRRTPVKSRIGPYIHLGAYPVNAKGQMKFSPDGTKLVMATHMNNVDLSGHSPGFVFLFDFDVNTGELSNRVKLMDDDFVFAYGVEFSPDSKKVYASVSSFKNGEVPPSGHFNTGSSLWQIDLEDNYRVRKIFDDDAEPAALQLAIDGKIYKAHEGLRHLGVINYPNRIGRSAVEYVDNGLLLDRASQKGLPGFVQSYFQVRVNYEEACEGAETKLSTNYLPEPDDIAWDFGDGSPVFHTTDKEITHVYPSGGTYRVRATITKGTDVQTYSRNVIVRALPVLRSASITQCEEDGDGIADFNLYEPSERINPDPEMLYSFYYTEADAINDINAIPRNEVSSFSNALATRIFTRATSPYGCWSVTHIDLEVSTNSLPPNFMVYFSACDNAGNDINDSNGIAKFDFSSVSQDILALFPNPDGLTVNYYRTQDQALAEINEIDPTQYINVNSPYQQELWVRVEGEADNTCIGLGQHLTLVVDEVPDFELAVAKELCQKQYPYAIGVTNPAANYTYTWTDSEGNIISNSQDFNATRGGTYLVTATKTDGTGCTKSKEIEITTVRPPVITEVDVDGIITLRSTATVLTETEDVFEYALDNEDGPYQNSNIFYEVAPGIHTAFVRDKSNCELVSMDFSVIGHPAFFTPNNDGVNDYWQIQGVSESLQSDSLIHIYDRYGVLLAQLDPTSIGWDGMTEGQMLPASDYWFRVKLEDGREFSGHFALKR